MTAKGPFKCYIMEWGVGGGVKNCYEGVQFNGISIMKGGCVWVLKFPENSFV